jgi:hypothetical protein
VNPVPKLEEEEEEDNCAFGDKQHSLTVISGSIYN